RFQSDRTGLRQTESILPGRSPAHVRARLRVDGRRPGPFHARRMQKLRPALRLLLHYIEIENALIWKDLSIVTRVFERASVFCCSIEQRARARLMKPSGRGRCSDPVS